MQSDLRHPERVNPHAEWRFNCLCRAGFSAQSADRLADDPAFDLHSLLELIDRGCPPELAVRIVAPLEWSA